MKIAFWIFTGILCLFMLLNVAIEVFMFDQSVKMLADLGFPKFIAYVLPVVKFLGVAAILSNYSKSLKEWAYAGFFFDFALAALAHYFSGVPSMIPALVSIVFLFASYFLDKKVRP